MLLNTGMRVSLDLLVSYIQLESHAPPQLMTVYTVPVKTRFIAKNPKEEAKKPLIFINMTIH